MFGILKRTLDSTAKRANVQNNTFQLEQLQNNQH